MASDRAGTRLRRGAARNPDLLAGATRTSRAVRLEHLSSTCTWRRRLRAAVVSSGAGVRAGGPPESGCP